MARVLPVLLLIVAACSPGEEAQVVTTTAPAPTTIPLTSTAPPATTTLPPTTTTVPPTTTTVPPTTTTSEGLAGAWADEPLIVTGFGALGWWDGTQWVIPEDVGGLPVTGGEDYQIATLDIEGTVVGGPPALVCEPLGNPGVELSDPEVLGYWPGPYGVAISAPWELQPSLVEEFTDDGTYAAFAAQLLAERGMEVAEPVIKQAFRLDLEGDGINEVLVVAEELSEGLYPEGGEYSIVFMRKVVEGEVQTAVLGETLIFDPLVDFLVSYSVGAVADLSGDGKMEIVIDAGYYEGIDVGVWEYVDDDLGLVLQIRVGCGA
jgi:hypothetical protein